MSYTETRNFTFDEISVWDWYDGIVRATGTSLGRPYFITLAAWDSAGRRKAYLLSELHAGLADKLKSLEGETNDAETKQKTWDSFTRLFENYLQDYTGALYLSLEEPEVGREISSRSIDTKHLRTLRNYNVEMTVSEDACTYWFDSKFVL
jgi:hypothetical protein